MVSEGGVVSVRGNRLKGTKRENMIKSKKKDQKKAMKQSLVPVDADIKENEV